MKLTGILNGLELRPESPLSVEFLRECGHFSFFTSVVSRFFVSVLVSLLLSVESINSLGAGERLWFS